MESLQYRPPPRRPDRADLLIVHDEAHLSHAFQSLLTRVVEDRPVAKAGIIDSADADDGVDRNIAGWWGRSAPPHARGRGAPCRKQRLDARKGVAFHAVNDEKGAVAGRIAQLALIYRVPKRPS
jgi:hypothetical protein